MDDHKELVQELEEVHNWFVLGLYLGVRYDELIMIERTHSNLLRCKIEVLWGWLRKLGHKCTWRRVVEVLIQMGETAVADTIKLKYLTPTTGMW